MLLTAFVLTRMLKLITVRSSPLVMLAVRPMGHTFKNQTRSVSVHLTKFLPFNLCNYCYNFGTFILSALIFFMDGYNDFNLFTLLNIFYSENHDNDVEYE